MESETWGKILILSIIGIVVGVILNFVGCISASGAWILLGFCATNGMSLFGIFLSLISIFALLVSSIALVEEDSDSSFGF
jgi:putative flippase GtrA